MTRTGIIQVPLFTAPYTLPASIDANAFRRYSWYPQMGGAFQYNAIPANIGLVNTLFMGVAGPANILSEITFGAGSGTIAAPVFLGQSLDGGNIALTTPNEQALYTIPMSPLNGNQNAFVTQAQFVNQPVFSAQGVGLAIAYDNGALQDATMPFFDPTQGPAGGPMAGIASVRVALGSAITAVYLQRPSLLQQSLDMFDPGISWNSWQNHVLYYQCPAQNGLIYGLWDTNNAQPPYTIPRQILAYRPQPFTGSPAAPLFNYTPVFDDPTLQNVWNGFENGYTLDIWKGGWIIKLGAAGTGPTGQQNEIAVTDPGMTTYNLLRFIPQDNGAQTQLNHATSFGWQVKIDPNGVLYFNSGNTADQTKILYSYSPVNFFYPQFVYKPGFISLPCYTPCDAVTI